MKINLIYPLDFVGETSTDSRPIVILELELPDQDVRKIPFREIPSLGQTGEKITGQEQYIHFTGKANVGISLEEEGYWLGQWTEGNLAIYPHLFAEGLELNLKIGLGEGEYSFILPDQTKSKSKFTPLLYGSISIHHTDLVQKITDIPRRLKSYWPTHNIDDIEAFRFEPSGIYLVGKIPNGILLESQQIFDTSLTSWALRIPQPAPPIRNEDGTLQLPDRAAKQAFRWLLTAEEFKDGDGLPLVNSHRFLTAVRDTFSDFEENKEKKSLLDNIVMVPQPDAVVEITRSYNNSSWDNQIEWRTSAVGARLVIGGEQAGESQFIPEVLTGIAELKNDNWQHLRTRFVAGREITNDEEEKNFIALSRKRDSNELEFNFPEEKIVALNLPTIRTAVETSVDQKAVVDTVERAWMCLQEGWLGLDAKTGTTSIAPQAAEPARLGLLRIDQILKAFNSTTTLGGFEIQLLPVQGTSAEKEAGGRHIFLELYGDFEHAQLSLKIEKPLTLLTTPAVWLNDSSEDKEAEAAHYRERDWVPSLAARMEEAGVRKKKIAPDNPEAILREIFSTGDWVSKFATEKPNESENTTRPGALEAVLAYEKQAFTVSFHGRNKNNSVFWKHLKKIPLVRTFPLPTSPTPTVLLEDNRSLIPFEPAGDQNIRISFLKPKKNQDTPPDSPIDETEFFETGLPQIGPEDKNSLNIHPYFEVDTNVWRLAPLFGNHFMLPTLPGLEAFISADKIHWNLRHAPPVLDEAYREVTESDEQSISTDDQGLDLTRVESAIALEKLPEPEKAAGVTLKGTWLPDGMSESANKVEIQDFSVVGKNPQLQIKLANEKTISFARNTEHQGSGLTQKISIITQPGTSENLPSFDVSFSTSEDSFAPEICRSGQPLIATFDDIHGITTFDGKGTVRHEPINGTVKFRTAGESEDTLRLTGTYQREDLTLDLVGIEVSDKPINELSDLNAQQWMLHDGNGGWPKLFGFVVRPVSLRLTSLSGGTITGVLLPSAQAEQQLQLPVTHAVQIEFELHADDVFKITTMTGSLDWQFDYESNEIDKENDVPHLIGIRAEIDQLASNYIAVNVSEIILSIPTGIVRVTPQDLHNGIHAKILEDAEAVGKLIIDPVTRTFRDDAVTQLNTEITLETINIPSETQHPLPIDDCKFSWMKESEGGTAWTLSFVKKRNLAKTIWEFEITPPNIKGYKGKPISYTLKAENIRKRRFVFAAETNNFKPSDNSFFELKKSSGILSITFSTPIFLSSLSGELLFQLQKKDDGSASENTESLVGRLSISSVSRLNSDLNFRMTGSFKLTNSIALKREDGKVIKHQVRFFMDDAEMPIAAILYGKHSNKKITWCGVVTEHILSLADEPSPKIKWQTAQWLRLMSYESYKALYNPSGTSIVESDDLVIDASTVLLLQNSENENISKSPQSVPPDIQNQRFGVSIAIRTGNGIDLDKKARIVRQPFASLIATKPVHTITLNENGPILELDSKGSQHSEPLLPGVANQKEAQFFRRSPTAGILFDKTINSRLKPFNEDLTRFIDNENKMLVALPSYQLTDDPPEKENFYLPTQLNDLGGLIPSEIIDEDKHMAAACLARRNPVETGKLMNWWQHNGQLLADSTLLEFPYRVQHIKTSKNSASDRDNLISVQLLNATDGLSVIAKDILKNKDVDEVTWAKEVLAAKPRGILAVVLKNFSELVPVPATFEDLRDELPDSTSFSYNRSEIRVIDPRCRIPGQKNRLEALPKRTIFTYKALISKTEETNRPVIAATQFSLAAINDDTDQNRLGHLRNAVLHTEDLASFTQWNEVQFDASLVYGYPNLNMGAITNTLPPSLSEKENPTLVAPLMHVVSWASRPGEMMSTTWGYEEHKEKKNTDGDTVITSSIGLPSVTTLRRPRAQAGKFESARLKQESTEITSIFNRFNLLKFDLEQTLGRTVLPPEKGIVAALVTPDAVFPSFEKRENAEVEPTLVYRKSDKILEPLSVFLFAGKDYDPTKDSGLITQAFLVLRPKGDIVPNDFTPYSPEESNDPDFQPKFPKNNKLLAKILKKPEVPKWTPHQKTDVTPHIKVYSSLIAIDHDLESEEIEIVLLRYYLKSENNPTDNQFHLIEGGEQVAFSIKVLNRDAAIRPPEMSVTLLAPDETDSNQVYCAGYGRLGSEDFTPPEPELRTEISKDDQKKSSWFYWLRFSKLVALERNLTGNDSATGEGYEVVVYGSGGELLPDKYSTKNNLTF